jgi:MFS family permease
MTRSAQLRTRFVNEDNRRWWTLAAMCFALFMIMLDNTVVNVALPSIQKDLHSSISGLEWTVNAYTLAFAVLLVTGGRLGDIFGRRRTFIIGVVVFGLSSAFIGFSQSEAWLVTGRALQGFGAAFMMPATLSIIANAFPPQDEKESEANVGLSDIRADLDPPRYLKFVQDWRQRGAGIVGGCCGIGPEHIAEIKRALTT